MKRKRQHGAAALMIVLFLLVVGSVAVVTALSISGSDSGDTAYQHNSVAALALAESALERVAGRMNATACNALSTEGPYTLGQGNFSVVAPAPYIDISLCRVRVSGTVGATTRTVDAWLSGGAITLEQKTNSSGTTANLTFAHTVAGTNRLLLVGVTVDQAGTAVTGVQYAGQALTQQAFIGTGGRPRAEIWSRLNPTPGNNNVIVSLTGNDQVVAGAMSFTGVNLTTPFDAASQTATNNSTAAAITSTPVTNNAWILDVISANNSVAVTMTALANRTQQWNLSVGGNIRGAASLYGPINPAGATTLQWTLANAQRWTMAAVALRPGGNAQVVRWNEVVN